VKTILVTKLVTALFQFMLSVLIPWLHSTFTWNILRIYFLSLLIPGNCEAKRTTEDKTR